ncbi:MAG: NADH-quinone oxidoreductase subunit NuoH [Deltaproteobacteria bacterium]|nr:NADH-quinone oxidoreductase subunit NuoH [Deltaproteobacteria bacterium]
MANSALFAHSLQDWIGIGPLWVWAAVSAVVILYAIALPFAGIATYVERKVSADMQDRFGPNRVGPFGILQFIADFVKMLAKQDFIPQGADRILFSLAPILVLAGACAAFAVLPLSKYFLGADMNIGILYALAVTTLIAPGLLLGSWASQNKWSLLGGLRAAAQIISYEIPVALSIFPAILISGTLQIGQIVETQGWVWSAQAGTDYHFWNAFHNPFCFLAMFLLFVGGLAETNRIPFDLPEAESELVSGFSTEFSGMRFGLYALAEFVDIFVMSSIVVALYLGGWQLPFINIDQLSDSIPTLLVAFIQLGCFLVKVFMLVFVVMWLRWTLPRLRVDQLMAACWKGLVPLALVNLLGTAVWMWAFNGRSIAQLVLGPMVN